MPRQASPAKVVAIKHEHHGQFEQSAWDIERRDDHAGVPDADRDAWREEVIELLNDSLTPEMVCVLRYRAQEFRRDPTQPYLALAIEDEFVAHASDGQARADQIADRIANRIVDRIMQWEREPDGAAPLDRDPLGGRDQPARDDAVSSPLAPPHAADPVARLLGESHRRSAAPFGDKDPAMRRMREDALRDDEEHADDWLAR